MLRVRSLMLTLVALLALVLSACAGGDAGATTDDGERPEEPTAEETAEEGATDEPAPMVMATTTILADITRAVLEGTGAEVESVMPPGADPHSYQASAAQGVALREADLVVANGLNLEEALLDVLDAAEEDGATVIEVADGIDPIEGGHDHEGEDHDQEGEDEGHAEGEDHDHEGEDHDQEGEDKDHAEGGDHDHEGEDHDHEGEEAGGASVETASLEEGDEEHEADEDHDHGSEEHADGEEGHDHDHGAFDPHIWLDPVRVGEIAGVIADAYAGIDPDAAATVEQNAADYAEQMQALDDELQQLVAELDEDQRQLVTNHEALGYLAARYDLEVIDTVVPGTTTSVDVTAEGFSELVTTIEEAGVPAIFADTSSSDRLAQALADEVGDVEVVELFTGSLGEPGSGADSVPGMIRTNVERIVEALG